MTNLFFELLQLSVGKRQGLSFTPSTHEWVEAFDIAKKQAVVGVCFYGVQCAVWYDDSCVVNLPLKLKMQWLALTANIQRRNEVMNRRCTELYERIKKSGYHSCVLKGQAVAMRYDAVGKKKDDTRMSLLRQSGDIDMWMVGDVNNVLRWARDTKTMHYFDYHHADLSLFPDVEVELHYRPSISRNLWRNVRLQKWFKNEGRRHIVYNKELGFGVPDDVFALVLTLNHNLWHLLYEGVGLRQMMDLYFVVRTASATDELSHLLHHFQLERFASASAWVLWHLFDRESDASLFVSQSSPLPVPNERLGRFLLAEILKAGNFGHYDKRLKANRYSSRIGLMMQWLRHTMRLVRHFPGEVAWTPVGIMYISLWRRWKWFVGKWGKVTSPCETYFEKYE